MGSGTSRIIEVDALRGVAIVMMVIFHFIWDLGFFGLIGVSLYTGPQAVFAYSIGALFLLLVGVSLTLSYSRALSKMDRPRLLMKYLGRGLRLLALGVIISIVTWLFIGEGFIVFGVISCIGLSIILAYPLINRPTLALSLGALIVVAGMALHQFSFGTYWLLWLGFIPDNFLSVDYFPLLPWFGVVLIGIALGHRIYGSNPVSRIKKATPSLKSLALLGRHSLLIYLVHQPLIIGVLFLLTSN